MTKLIQDIFKNALFTVKNLNCTSKNTFTEIFFFLTLILIYPESVNFNDALTCKQHVMWLENVYTKKYAPTSSIISLVW